VALRRGQPRAEEGIRSARRGLFCAASAAGNLLVAAPLVCGRRLHELFRKIGANLVTSAILACALAGPAFCQSTGPTSITLDQAIQMALQHNHNLLAARTTIQQSESQETTANLRPNPSLFTDGEYLPFFSLLLLGTAHVSTTQPRRTWASATC